MTSELLGRIWNEDCLETMRRMEDKSVDLIVTDPPYGIDFQSAWRTDKTKWKPKIANDSSPFIAWIPFIPRILSDCGAVVCFCRWDVSAAFQEALDNAGLSLKSEIIWDKVVHGMGDLAGAFAPQHENALFATKDGFKFCGNRPASVIRQRRVMPEDLMHPNEKPVELMERLVKSVGGDTVYDPFMGSGTTAVACEKLGRRWIGSEINPDYCKIAEKRIEAVRAQGNLFGATP